MALPIDLVLVLGVLGLAACSLITIHAATADDVAGDPGYYFQRQVTFFIIGGVLALAMIPLNYSRLRPLKWWIYGFLMASIFAVKVMGTVAKGAQRSIALGPFQLQASELGKILLVLVLAAFAADRVRRLRERDTTARIMLLALIPAAFVMIQPDLGSSLVYGAISLAILYFAGVPARHFAALGALVAIAVACVLVVAPKAGVEVLHPYQKERLTSFLHPTADTGGAGYQQHQSVIAVGSGQKTGRGDRATQTKLNFLPEHHTDFINAVVGERWGFVGAALVLSLYALLIWRGLRILTMAKDLFGALVAGGIVAMLLFQVFVNVGMTLGIMPITGIPLPLMSYGGSSVVSTLLAIGLLQSIYVQGRASAAIKGRIKGH
ncbi:MAG TPA: rod shape-determining protein RodA [Baekduia sp.]|nr:rod shape-determining protein RodA [Baekduia sp.]